MNLSFEFFPPRNEQGKQALQKVRQQLRVVNPDYFSVTFGAAGSAQTATVETVLDIQKSDDISAVPHLSCIDAEQKKVINLLDQYQAKGINRLVVLRGDIPSGVRDIGYFHYANELVAFIKNHYSDQFHIEVAAYPEKHPQASDIRTDLAHFANKVKAGADGAITQYFYNPEAYFRFVDEADKLGVKIPITPGIMPITNYAQLLRFSNFCGAEIPQWIAQRLEYYQNDLTALCDFGEEVVANLCQTLKNQGVDSFHFYTMNRTQPALKLAQILKK